MVSVRWEVVKSFKSRGHSERRACAFAGLRRSTCRYKHRRRYPAELTARLGELASQRPRFGYRRLHALLRREGRSVTRRAGVDAVVIKSLTGHVTEKMREHYSTVALDEKLVAVSSVHRLVPVGSGDAGGDENAGQKNRRGFASLTGWSYLAFLGAGEGI